jgi:hypothetical protein
LTKKTIIILSLIVIGLFFIWTGFLWKTFSCGFAGSYPCVETWSLNIKEKDLIELIKEIKKEHPELEPPNVSYATSVRNSYWYNITFYYPDTKENVYTWTRPNNDSTFTTLAFVAIATHIDSLTPIKEINMDRKEINRDYNYFANKREIWKFENKILDLIETKIYDRQKNGNR